MATKRTERLDAEQRHRRRMDWFIAEAYRQAGNRDMRAKCERFYDSEQWDAKKKADIESMGQLAVTYNEIKPTIDWLIGTERRTRVDFQVMPRDAVDKQTTQDAETKTKVLKWLEDVNRSSFERSYAWDDAMKSGLGWLEVGVRGDMTDCPIYTNAEPWRNMLHDSMASRLDGQDSRYVFRIKVVDLDIALAYFPDKEKELLKVRQNGTDMQNFSTWFMGAGNTLDLGLLSGSSYDQDNDYALPPDLFNPRERVLLVECWSLEPNMGNAQRLSPSSFDRVRLGVNCSIMTEFDTLIESPSPYNHGRFPFIPVWAYRNKRTGLPYSPIWPLIEKQEALNQVMSKAWFEMSLNRTILEKGAVDSEVMTIAKVHEEMQDPNGTIILANGALSGGKIKTERGLDKAQAQMALAGTMRESIREESSVTPSNRGLDSAAISGKAIGLQQDQGSVLSTELFDNARLARQIEGEMTLSLAEQYLVDPMVIALPSERKQSQMVEINKPMDDGTVLNDISARKSQFVVGEQAWRQSMAQAAFESMMELMGKLAPVAPQVVTAMLDLVFEYADLPNKETLLERIRAITGQAGPNGQETPEQQAAKQQKADADKKMFDLQLAQLQADVAVAQKQGDKLDAETMSKRLEALYMSAQAAQVLGMAPQVTPIADELLASAGFIDAAGQPVIDPAAVQQIPQSQPIQDPMQADGALAGSMAGSITPGADGVIPQ